MLRPTAPLSSEARRSPGLKELSSLRSELLLDPDSRQAMGLHGAMGPPWAMPARPRNAWVRPSAVVQRITPSAVIRCC